jgi:uncharacterized protein YecE (DUF72 family)
MPTAWVGISGYSYNHWQGLFYPDDLPKAHRREFAASQFNAVEINGSFYGMIPAPAWVRYREAAKDHSFRWAVKGNRYITHTRKMKDRTALANFFASGVLELGETMGPILWHVPPRTNWHPELFSRFLSWLPKDSDSAYRLAREHDAKVEQPQLTGAYQGPLTHVIEVRSRVMLLPEMFDMLAEHEVGFALTDSAGSWPYAEEVTGPVVYCRLHGHEQTYVSRYSDEQLDWWAKRARAWMAGKPWNSPVLMRDPARQDQRRHDVYFFFDNDGRGHAPFDARRLAERLDAVPATAEDHGSLFARAPAGD